MKRFRCIKELKGYEEHIKVGEIYEPFRWSPLFIEIKLSENLIISVLKKYFEEVNEFGNKVKPKKVICVNNMNIEDKLCRGEEYTIIEEVVGSYFIKAEDGKAYWFNKDRFVDVVEENDIHKRIQSINYEEVVKRLKASCRAQMLGNNSKLEEESMDKKEVLRIEYAKAFDTWYGRVEYQDEDILKRGEFIDDKLGIISCAIPGYNKETNRIRIRGYEHSFDKTEFKIGTDEELEDFKDRINKLNEKYGIKRKSWKEMVDECEEVPFKAGEANYYLFFSHNTNEVYVEYSKTYEEYKKYISKEDAEIIIKKCAENNRG